MDQLIAALDPLQTDSVMRQLWLETQWLRNNLKDGRGVPATAWQPMIYKLPQEIDRHAEVSRLAKRLCAELRRYASNGDPPSKHEAEI